MANLFMLVDSPAVFMIFCFVMPNSQAACNVLYFIMYLVVLYQLWCLYHNYVGEVIRVKIIWHYNGSFGSLSNHFSCFFRGSRPSFNGPTCYYCLLRMLGFDCFYIHFSFSTRSPYSSWYSGTCKNWYLSFPGSTTRYPCDVIWGHLSTCFAFWKFSGAILSSNATFLDTPTIWVGISVG